MSDDGYTRITLRIPDSLHARLTEEAGRTSKSMNAEIIGRLEESFGPKSIDDITIKDVIEQTVRRSLDEAGAFLLKHQVEHIQPRNLAAHQPDNMLVLSRLEHELMSIDESAHSLLAHANAIALIHGEDHDAYQRFMKDAADLRRIEVGLRDTLDQLSKAARKKIPATKRKTTQ